MKNKILFVHGFGVKKDARGMFTDIAKSLQNDLSFSEYEYILTDLNVIDAVTSDIYLNPLSKQADILKSIYRQEEKGSCVTIISHSQGCVVTALAYLPKVKNVILLAPPTNNDIEKTINSFKNREGSLLNTKGDSTLMRSDGSKTIVPKEYWTDRNDINYIDEYKVLSKSNNLTFVLAGQDEIVSNESEDVYSHLGSVVKIDGDHNFEGKDRGGLIEEIKKLL